MGRAVTFGMAMNLIARSWRTIFNAIVAAACVVQSHDALKPALDKPVMLGFNMMSTTIRVHHWRNNSAAIVTNASVMTLAVCSLACVICVGKLKDFTVETIKVCGPNIHLMDVYHIFGC